MKQRFQVWCSARFPAQRGARSPVGEARTTSLFLFVASIFFITAPLFADSIRPAYLEIIETHPGVVDIVWKVPKVQGLPSNLFPKLPGSFQPTKPIQKVDMSDAVIRKWSMVGEPLAGQRIDIRGLESFTMDALLRVELNDGTTFRTVLRPAAPGVELPAPASGGKGIATAMWLYPALFAAAFALSLLPSARKCGIAFCSAALIAGSLAGHGAGRTLPRPEAPLSETEAKQVIQGLVLNTYRAFIMDTDEEVYDVLARSVDGDALGEIFLSHRDRMRFDDPESAASLVDRLDVKAIDALQRNSDGSYTMLIRWDVYGSVFHWEHVHFRCNAFKAELTIAPADGYWKISRLEVLDEERVI